LTEFTTLSLQFTTKLKNQLSMLISGLIISLLISCGAGADFEMNKVDRMEYRFKDSSVPPEYHRSFTIILTTSKIYLVVDCYGDTLNRQTYKDGGLSLKELKKAFSTYNISKGKKKKDDGCSGGTTDEISCFIGEKAVFNAWLYHCADGDGGTLRGDIEGFVKEFRSTIYNLDKELE